MLCSRHVVIAERCVGLEHQLISQMQYDKAVSQSMSLDACPYTRKPIFIRCWLWVIQMYIALSLYRYVPSLWLGFRRQVCWPWEQFSARTTCLQVHTYDMCIQLRMLINMHMYIRYDMVCTNVTRDTSYDNIKCNIIRAAHYSVRRTVQYTMIPHDVHSSYYMVLYYGTTTLLCVLYDL